MALLSTVIGRGVTGSKPAATDVPVGSLYFDTTLERLERSTGAAWEICDASTSGGDVSYAIIQISQLINEIKGWPPIVRPDADLDALNLWWDKVGTPTTAPTVVDVAGEAGITENYELALKVVADASGEGLLQRFTYADEPRLKSGRVCSTLLAIWSVSTVSVTAKLLNSDASETVASAVSAAAWTIVKVENHTLAGTYCDLQITLGAAGTCYVVPLGLNIGEKAFPLPPRGLRMVDVGATNLVNGVDPGGASFADLNLAASTSPLTTMVDLAAHYYNNTTAGKSVSIRRNGDTVDANEQKILRAVSTGTSLWTGRTIVPCDDSQIVEWKTDGAVSDTEIIYISLTRYWEWA